MTWVVIDALAAALLLRGQCLSSTNQPSLWPGVIVGLAILWHYLR